MKSQHTIQALVQNEAGTLNRLVSLFRRRGFNLASLNAGDCEVEGFSRVTLVVNGDDEVLQQCVGQLQKLIDVVSVDDLPFTASVMRELALIHLTGVANNRREILDLLAVADGKIVHFGLDSLTVEVSGDAKSIDRFIAMLGPYHVTEVVRTGVVGLRTENRIPSELASPTFAATSA
ncbi:MAG: acetolactate synthase small subunit [Armatimonadetes bacterium]|nr:acetolactate synthase small subunit [Armatimonadota bacterium]